MSRSTAQAALQAAATVYSGTNSYITATTITDLAYTFKQWLDQHEQVSK